MQEIIGYLVVGFVCIAFPILLTIFVFMCPIYVIISYLLWLLVSFGYMCKTKNKKISEYIMPLILFDIIFTIIFMVGASSVGIFDDEDTWMLFLYPAFCLPAIIFIGLKMRSAFEHNVQEKINELRKDIKTNIEQKILEISKFKTQLNGCNLSDKATGSLMQLITICTNDNSLKTLYNNASGKIFDSHISSFKGIIPDDDMPQNKEQFDLYVVQQLKTEKEYRDILNKINTYDYKGLKTLYSQHKN